MIPNSQHRLIVGDKIDPVWLRFLQSLDGKADASDISAIATALGSPDGTVANIPDLSASTVRVLQGAGIAVTRGEGGEYYIALRPLGDSGAGTFKLLTRDSSGRLSGTADGTASDVPYDNTTSGLAATDVQAAVDELQAEKLGDAPSDGNTYGRKDGAWAVATGGGVLQRYAYSESNATASVAPGTNFPFDNTIPQITEGVAYPSLDTAITPSSATSLLEVEVTLPWISASGQAELTFGIFRDSGPDALIATTHSIDGAGWNRALTLRAVVVAGATTATTFQLRWGADAATGYLNYQGGNFFGGAVKSTMTVRELAP